MAKRKGKIYFYRGVEVRPTTQKSNIGNLGYPTIKSNVGIVKVRATVKKKTD